MAKRKSVPFRIQLTPDAKKALTDISDGLGITQIYLSGRLMEWFAGQHETVQAAILGLYPDVIKSEVATLILKRMENSND